MYDSVAQNQAHRQPIDMAALENAIVKCASETKTVLLLIDAINESSEMDNAERLLLNLAKMSPNIRILVSTTAIGSSNLPQYTKALNISAEMMRSDIDAFIKHRMNQEDTLKSLPQKLKTEIEKTLLDNANGS